MPSPNSDVLRRKTRPTASLSGWGANERVDCFVSKPELPSDVWRHLDSSGTVARGLGRSYGDAATNRQRQVLHMVGLDRVLAFDEQTGICEAGVSLERIVAFFAPRGWFPMITPGTKYVTVGGCIGSDVHGKAHHSQGCFSNSLREITILLANGEVVVVKESYLKALGCGLSAPLSSIRFTLDETGSIFTRHACHQQMIHQPRSSANGPLFPICGRSVFPWRATPCGGAPSACRQASGAFG